MKIAAYANQNAKEKLKLISIDRREVKDHDIAIDIEYCGVCHSDVHTARDEWGGTMYPCVPGHEIVGHVLEVGKKVKKFKKGDLVGVGCMVDSCKSCHPCESNLEQFCEKGATFTYNSEDSDSNGATFGGYSESIVVQEQFVLNVSDKLDVKAVAPLLCAGITMYSPLKHWKVKKGDKVGVIGLGGLGHMGVKFASAMGAKVVMITRSKDKGEDAKRLGADEVVISTDEESMVKNNGSFDFLLNTIPVGHDLNPYLKLLKIDSTMVLVGAVEPLKGLNGANLILGRKRVAGSLIGGIKETQEMLDFCAEHNIVSDIEMINMDYINEAYDRVVDSDVKFRFVIDMKSLEKI